jgi:cyclophilin family peptidyl-prolyl cis-trans isomerase
MKELRMQQLQKRKRQRLFFGAIGAAVVIIVVIVLVTTLSGPAKKTPAAAPPVSVPLINAPAKPGCPKLDGLSVHHYTHFPSAPPMCINPDKTYLATIVTDAGTIKVNLLAKSDPKTVNNFVFLAGYHFYDGTIFHRVVTGFVDQGGDPKGTGAGGPGYSFNGGAPKSTNVYTAGALAMANSGSPSSDGSQFFIVVGKGGKELKANYSYFGQVTSGMSVVNKINADGSSTSAGVPVHIHRIVKVTISEP